MQVYKIKSYAKINISLGILSKLKSKIHKIESLFSFIGESEQIPPFFSALKYQGKPLYKYAREGRFIMKPARKILIKEINDYKYSNKVCSFTVCCTKGTYIRSLAHDFGQHLNSGAHLSVLRRTKIGDFSVENGQSIDEFVTSLEA